MASDFLDDEVTFLVPLELFPFALLRKLHTLNTANLKVVWAFELLFQILERCLTVILSSEPFPAQLYSSKIISGWKFPSETYVEVSMKIYLETSGNLVETFRKLLTRFQILETSYVGPTISNIGFF